MIPAYRIEAAGDAALQVTFECESLAASNQCVGQLSDYLQMQSPVWLIDQVPAFVTLLACYELAQFDHMAVRAALHNAVQTCFAEFKTDTTESPLRHWQVPCWYDAPKTQDLARISTHTGLSKAEIIESHQACLLTVYAVGFAPGFAFLGELPETLSTPRLETPRKRVPAGAVALANRQSAVYPNVSPGGWNLIGLCPLVMFDMNEPQSEQLQVGDSVQFYAIDAAEFEHTLGQSLSTQRSS